MNNKIFKGNWNQIKGKLKEKWGKLTDNDMKEIEGQHDRIYGLLQERYGRKKEEIQKEIDEFNRAA